MKGDFFFNAEKHRIPVFPRRNERAMFSTKNGRVKIVNTFVMKLSLWGVVKTYSEINNICSTSCILPCFGHNKGKEHSFR